MTNKIFETAIVGGGFSGLSAACALGEVYGDSVVLLEATDRVGKKILATGNGRCNVTNRKVSAGFYHSVEGCDVEKILRRFGTDYLIEKLAGFGVPVSFEGDKGYPISRQASAVCDALRLRVSYIGVQVFTGFRCDEITKRADGIFVLYADKSVVMAKTVILCSGGRAGVQYGCDGSGYKLAENFSHSVTKLLPSLVQLKTETAKIKGLKGIKCEATVRAYVGERLVAESSGDVLFTDYGVSGNAVFSVSSYLTGNDNAKVKISFVPDMSEEELTTFILNSLKTIEYLGEENILGGVVNKRIARAAINAAGGNLTVKTAAAVAKELKNFTLKVNGTLGFDSAQVTRGGVKFAEVDCETMESKLVKGLYFAGEILDVDGDCGGFNLQWAFSSAVAAADDIMKR